MKTNLILCISLATLFAIPEQAEATPSLSVFNDITVAVASPASRKNYRPSTRRRLPNIGFTGDFSDWACYTWLTDDDIYYLNPTELRILRNTIYARHGRKFKDPKLRKYFSQFRWYRPTKNEVNPNELSETELHNISLIQSWE